MHNGPAYNANDFIKKGNLFHIVNFMYRMSQYNSLDANYSWLFESIIIQQTIRVYKKAHLFYLFVY